MLHFTCVESTRAILQQNNIQVVKGGPGLSPDLNPIENLWAWMVQRLRRRRISNLQQLRAALRQVWNEVPPALLRKLASSMHKRLELVMPNQGAHTGY